MCRVSKHQPIHLTVVLTKIIELLCVAFNVTITWVMNSLEVNAHKIQRKIQIEIDEEGDWMWLKRSKSNAGIFGAVVYAFGWLEIHLQYEHNNIILKPSDNIAFSIVRLIIHFGMAPTETTTLTLSIFGRCVSNQKFNLTK